MRPETYLLNCWNCLGEFDAMTAVWCSDDPKNPTKLCPFCLRCFCDASEEYKRNFLAGAPSLLQDELSLLQKVKDRLGDVLIRMKKLTTPQLIEAIAEQQQTGRRLGEVLVERGLVTQDDIDSVLRSQGVPSPTAPAPATAATAPPPAAVTPGTSAGVHRHTWDQSSPDQVLHHLMTVAARKGASDIQIEPKEDAVSVKYRIDGFFFRADPVPKEFQTRLTELLFQLFGLEVSKADRPLRRRAKTALDGNEYDLVLQTLPTPHGLSATVKLINHSTFLKDFQTLGLEVEDRIRLIEELGNSFGLVLVTAPVFNGAHTTTYSVMHFLVEAGRDVVSLEAPVRWAVEGARQVEVAAEDETPNMVEALRSAAAVRPEVVLLSAMPDRATAQLAIQIASSALVGALMPAQSAVEAVRSFIETGVASHQVAGTLAAVTCQRLVRLICPGCREAIEGPDHTVLAQHGLTVEQIAGLRFFHGKGCPACNKVGYRGRRAIFEVLTGVPEVRAAIQNGLPDADVETLACGAGMKTLRERCIKLVGDGITTWDEFTRLRL